MKVSWMPLQKKEKKGKKTWEPHLRAARRPTVHAKRFRGRTALWDFSSGFDARFLDNAGD